MREGSQQAEAFACSTRDLFTMQFTSFYAEIIQRSNSGSFCPIEVSSRVKKFLLVFWSVSLSAHYDDAQHTGMQVGMVEKENDVQRRWNSERRTFRNQEIAYTLDWNWSDAQDENEEEARTVFLKKEMTLISSCSSEANRIALDSAREAYARRSWKAFK